MSAPSQVGEYVLIDRLGSGGMGDVHRARHTATGAEFAVKLLSLGHNADLALRFQREAQAQAALSGHPNVVRVHEEARRLVIGLVIGLAHAHARGILQRDLKPANVLLDPDGRPRLVDFGLARIAGERSLTATGEVLGSPNWMAPEQALGEPVDERTDVYGLGAPALLSDCLRSGHGIRPQCETPGSA